MNIQCTTTGSGLIALQQALMHSSEFTRLRLLFLKRSEVPQALLDICSSLLQPCITSVLLQCDSTKPWVEPAL